MGSKNNEARMKNFALNRQAAHYYHFLEKFEAGIELRGTEVKSIREGKVILKDSYGMVKGGEAWLMNCHISTYSSGSYLNHDPLRNRRLLLHQREIDRLISKTQEKGLTLIPTRLYLKGNKIKCELALAKGKKVYDRRETERQRTVKREAEKAIQDYRRRGR
jgi:SsrA-binding protein